MVAVLFRATLANMCSAMSKRTGYSYPIAGCPLNSPLQRRHMPAIRIGRQLSTHSASFGQRRSRFRRNAVLIIVAAGILLPSVKVYLACHPLSQNSSSKNVSPNLGMLPHVGDARDALTWRMWLASEASDRLIRDIYVAGCIISNYWAISHSEHALRGDWERVHEKSAEQLLALCRVNKGVYVKLAQHIGQLDYLLPEQYVTTLRVMCGAAPEDDWESVKRVWAAEFNGQDIEKAFAAIDKTPIASASLAQVHVAYLHNTGRKVAIKVQHAGLRETSVADIGTVVALVHLVKAIFPKFDYLWLADELQANLPKELDFLQEADNLERTRKNFARMPAIALPNVHRELCTSRVLTMDFEEGVYVNDLSSIRAMALDPKDVAKLVAEVFAAQIFQHGWVHCDPHQANLLVRPMSTNPKKPQLVILDHGLYRELKPELKYNYAKLWRSIVMGDEMGIAKYASRLGAGHAYQLFAAMLTTRSWDRIMAAGEGDLEGLRVTGKDEDKSETAGYVREYADGIQDLLRTIPRDLLLILKTNDCLRAVDMSLGAPMNNFPIVARQCQTALNEKRAASRPGLLTWIQSTYETAALNLRLQAIGWAIIFARALPGQKREKTIASKATAKEPQLK